jgi:hypothetical protein
MATTRLAQEACKKQTQVVYMHTRLTVNDVVKDLLKTKDSHLNELTYYSWTNRNKKPPNMESNWFINAGLLPKLIHKLRIPKLFYMATPVM